MKVQFIKAFPYAQDALNLPVKDIETALPFYLSVMGFEMVSRQESPVKNAVLQRDAVRIGLAENGGDPQQEGCFFEVNAVEEAFAELQANGLGAQSVNYRIDKYGDTSFKVFFVVAPDGLCYCLGQRQH